jgi:hypothetical protein
LADLSGIMKELSKERDRLHQRLSGLNAALDAFAGVYRSNNGIKPRKGQKVVPIAKAKRTMSASARRKIAAAQVARWAKVKRGQRAA